MSQNLLICNLLGPTAPKLQVTLAKESASEAETDVNLNEELEKETISRFWKSSVGCRPPDDYAKICSDCHENESTDDDEDSLPPEASWNLEGNPLAEDRFNEDDERFLEVTISQSEQCTFDDSDSDPLDDLSVSSKISDSLSSFSFQDSPSTATTSSAYYTESIASVESLNTGIVSTDSSKRPLVQVPLRASIFPNMPPTIWFQSPDSKIPETPLNSEVSQVLKWQLTKTTPKILKRILVATGFKFTKKSNTWIGTWGRYMKAFEYQYLANYQKVNHFPGTFQIGRKDRMWKNLCRLRQLHSLDEFGFVPRTFILPRDLRKLCVIWNTARRRSKRRWILKPPAAARGKGIRIIYKYVQLPKHGTYVVQRYLSNPYLIDGSKFDLRIYVYVPSFNPLRIYLYKDGLVRFASVKYSNAVNTLGDRYMHLTNSSINKSSKNYTVSNDVNSCSGHKWSLKAFWGYLERLNIDTSRIWKNITDIVIKMTVSCHPCVSLLSHANVRSNYNCHEIFGFDIMLDENLKPWLLEVNVSPSLHSSSPLDVAIKGKMMKEVLNLAGFKLPAHLSDLVRSNVADALNIGRESICLNPDLYNVSLTAEEKDKHAKFSALERSSYLDSILESLLPRDVFHLAEIEDELSRAEDFERVFPTDSTHLYHKYFHNPQYYANLLDAWENKHHLSREKGRDVLRKLCEQRFHLKQVKHSERKSDIVVPEMKVRRLNHVCQVSRTFRSNSCSRKRFARTRVLYRRLKRPQEEVSSSSSVGAFMTTHHPDASLKPFSYCESTN